LRRRFDGLELAAAGAVDDVPAAGFELFANRIGLGKLALAAKLDAALEKLLSFGPIRSSWL
jgi:hypothetical protein